MILVLALVRADTQHSLLTLHCVTFGLLVFQLRQHDYFLFFGSQEEPGSQQDPGGTRPIFDYFGLFSVGFRWSDGAGFV